MTKISATVVGDSLSPQGNRLTTLLIMFPRFILAELNTHRMLSKNSASSRAIPFEKMARAVKTNPFIPIAWQKPHSGMQGTGYWTDKAAERLTESWRWASKVAVASAEELAANGSTKQLCNRLLEPFMWHTVLISGTEWENFFELRCPQYTFEGVTYKSWKDVLKNYDFERETIEDPILFPLSHNTGQAEIHMMALAEAIWDAQNESKPKQLKAGEWHIPFEDKIVELLATVGSNCHSVGEEWKKDKVKVATAMAARTSYTVVGDEKEISYERLIGIHDRMIAQRPFHASPFEHCARVMSDEEYETNVKGIFHPSESSMSQFQADAYMDDKAEGWCKNYRGFIQYRHFVEDNTQI